MNNKIKVLIGDDTAEYGVKIASQLRELGLYAYTRRRDGAILLDSIIHKRQAGCGRNGSDLTGF